MVASWNYYRCAFIVVVSLLLCVVSPVAAQAAEPDTGDAIGTEPELCDGDSSGAAVKASSETDAEEGISLASTVSTIPLSECTIVGAWAGDLDHNYTGSPFTLKDPMISVSGAVLKAHGVSTTISDTGGIYINKGLTWAYPATVTDAGTYTVTVTPNGETIRVPAYTGEIFYLTFSGSNSETFDVRPCNISNATVSGLKSSISLGSKQSPVLTYNGKTLKEGTDYSLEYKCDSRPGSAHLNIKGKGNFNGRSWYTYTVTGSMPTVSYAGADRFETAAKVNGAELAYGSYKGVIVASGEDGRYPDALCASGLSGLLNYPIVLVNGSGLSLDSRSASALNQIANKNSGKINVVVVGGTAAVDASIEKALWQYGSVTRLGGATRYDTAKLVYQYGKDRGNWNKDYALIARGDNFADSLSIAPYAVAKKAPVLLVDSADTILDSYFISELKQYKNALVLGGTSAVTSAIENQVNSLISGEATRLGGITRYDTSIAIAKWELAHGLSSVNMGFATGYNYPDSLVSGLLLSKVNAPLVLVQGSASSMPYSFKSFININGGLTEQLMYFGGTSAISAATRSSISTLFSQSSSIWVDEGSGDLPAADYLSVCGVCGYALANGGSTGNSTHKSHRLGRCPTCGLVGSYTDLGVHLEENAFGFTSCNGGNWNTGGSENINSNHRA